MKPRCARSSRNSRPQRVSRRPKRSCANSPRPAITSVERPLAALAEGNLYFRKSDSAVFIGTEAGAGGQARRPADRRGGRRGAEGRADQGQGQQRPAARRSATCSGTLTLGSRRSSGPARRRRDDVPQPGSGRDTRPRRRDRQGNCRQRQGESWSRRALPPSCCPTCPRPKSSRRSISSRRAATARRCRC